MAKDPKPEDRVEDGGQIKLRTDPVFKKQLIASAKALGIPASKYMLGLLREGDQAARFQAMLDKKGEPHVFNELAYGYQLSIASFWLDGVLAQLETSIEFSQAVYDEMEGLSEPKPLHVIFRSEEVRRASKQFRDAFRRKARKEDPLFKIAILTFCGTYRALTGFGGKSAPPGRYNRSANKDAWEWGTRVAVYFAVISVEMEEMLKRGRRQGLSLTLFDLPRRDTNAG
jgi:hypothetical protein